jgi:hypothetical protein
LQLDRGRGFRRFTLDFADAGHGLTSKSRFMILSVG